MRRLLPSARVALGPRVDQRFEIRPHRRRRGRRRRSRRRATRAPVVEDRAPDGEAAARAAPRGVGESARQRVDRRAQAQQHDAATIRIALGDQRVDRRPLGGRRRRQLPPLRIDAEVVEALHRAQQDVRLLPADASAARSRSGARARSPARRRRAPSPAPRSRGGCRPRRRDGTARGISRPARPATRSSVVPIERPCSNTTGFEPGHSTGRPIHQPRPVAALSASWP